MPTRLAALFAVASLVVAPSMAADGGPDARRPADPRLLGFERFVEEQLAAWRVPGAAVAIVRDGQVVLARGFGVADLGSGPAVTERTQFAIGSATKAFTTTLLATLVEEGKLDWDTPVRDLVPDFRLADDVATRLVTVRDLVSHRSGLPRHDLSWYGSPRSRGALFAQLRGLEPSASLRQRFQYQNLMYLAAGHVAEVLAGASWEDLVRGRITRKLGMEAVTFSVEEMQKSPDFARPYRLENGQVGSIPQRNIDAIGPAGSINANASDMARWVMFQLGQLGEKGAAVVSDAQLLEMHAPVTIAELPPVFPEMPHVLYALGWFVQPYRGVEWIHHGGHIDGFSALVSLLPQQRAGIVVLTNLDGTPLTQVVTLEAIDRLAGLEPIDWSARFREERDRQRTIQEESDRVRRVFRKLGTHPAHPLVEYAGAYENEAYGDLEIDQHADALELHFHGMGCVLDHWHYDVFQLRGEPFEGLLLQFATNIGGDVDSLSIQLEPAVDPIVFTRKPPAAMFDPEFLRPFAGEYALAGQTAVVELRGDTLYLSIPGQATYPLRPYRGTQFAVDRLAGYSVRFTVEDGRVTAALFIQPDRVYPAARR